MYKNTLESATFLSRTANHSTKGSRRGYDLLHHGENAAAVLSDEEARASMVARVQQIMAEIVSLPKHHPKRDELGLEQAELCAKISKIRKKKRAPGAGQHFIDVAKERLPKAVFQALMSEAVRRAGFSPMNAEALRTAP